VPEKVTPYFGRFRDTVMRQINQFTWAPRDNALDVVHGVMQPAIRFNRDDCVDLPPCLYVTREVELTTKQRKAYKEMLNKLKTEADSGEILAVNEAVKAQKLIQICCGVAYDAEGEEIVIDATPRMEAVMEVIEQAGTKVIVFAPYRHSIDTISAHLSKHGVVLEQIHGDVPAAKRGLIFKRFQEQQDPRVLVVQPQSAAHGVTLTAADTIVFWGPVMSVETYMQCCARADRMGQDSSKVLIVF
jgi:SNF2 family DNA or RNA helicase